MDRAPNERNFGHVTPNFFDVGEDVPRQAIEGVVAPADFQEFPHPVLQNMHRLESSDAGTYHAFSGSSIAGRPSTSAVYRPVSVTTAPPRSTPSSIAVQFSQLTSSSVPISMVSAGPSTSAVRFPVAVQGTRRVLTLPLRSPGKKPILTVGGNRLPPSVRQSGGEILIGKDKFYAVPITGQRMLKSGEGSVIQGIKRPAESVSGQGMPKVVIASNANMASFRQVIPVSRAAPPVQMSVAGPSTGYRVPTPVTIKTMSGQPVSAVTLESLMKAGISFPSARMGTPGAQRAPIVLNSTPGASALEAVALQPGAQNPSVVPAKNRVQHYIQIGGKFTRVEVIQDASKATVVQRPTAIQVQRTPAPAAAVAPRPAPAPPRLPAPVVEPALLDHNFAANASSRPASYAKKVAAAHKQALKYAESVPKWNLPDVNVGDFALDPADPLDAKILAEKNQNLPDEPQADVKPVEKTQSDPPPPLRTRKTCNCTKSMCLKLYCDCFASGEFCDGCNCLNCSNNMEHEGERQRAIAATLDRNPNAFRPKIGPMGGARERKRHNRGCNCKRSYCLKNYCECFEAKILCTHLCRCLGCRNQGDETSRQVLVQLCDAADQEAKARRKNHVASRFASKAEGEVNSAPPPVFEHALPPETFSFHTAPDLDGVWDYFRGEVIEATCMCLIGKGKEGVDQGLSEEKLEESIIAECKRCLDQIVRHAQGEQQLFQQMEQAAERAAERLKKNVIPDDDYDDDDDEDEDGGEEEEAGAQPGPSFVVPRSSRAGPSSSSVRKRLPV